MEIRVNNRNMSGQATFELSIAMNNKVIVFLGHPADSVLTVLTSSRLKGKVGSISASHVNVAGFILDKPVISPTPYQRAQ
jgi:hypothetical protein